MNEDQVPVYQQTPVAVLQQPGALDQVIENQIPDRTDSCQSESSVSSTSTDTPTANLPEFDFSLNDWVWHHNSVTDESPDSAESVTATSGLCLRVTRQPEEQHRARYLSEGSRGAIKDRSGTSNCTIQVIFFNRDWYYIMPSS